MNSNNLVKIVVFIFTIMMIGMVASCNNKQPSFTQDEVEKAVLALEDQALGFWSAGNPANFCVNFADDASYFDDIGAQTRLDGIEEIQNYCNSLEGAIPPHKYELVDTRVQSFDNTAILTLQYHSKLENGEPGGPPWKATSVYRYSDNVWQVVHANWSLIKAE
jgi:hypothetical protein